MALRAQQGFPGGSAVGAYWLARCEGFRVQQGRHVLGTVQQVRAGSPRGEAAALVVRRHGRWIEVPARRVLEIDPWAETLLVAKRERARRPVLRPAAASGGRAARTAVQGARRQAPRAGGLIRAALLACRRALAAVIVWCAPRAGRLASLVARGVVAALIGLLALLGALVGALDGVIAWLAPSAARIARSGWTALRAKAAAGRRRLTQIRPRHVARRPPSARRPL